MNWDGCSEVERLSGKVNCVQIRKGTGMQAGPILENAAERFTAAELEAVFQLYPKQVQIVPSHSETKR
jgi:hypothetical protein